MQAHRESWSGASERQRRLLRLEFIPGGEQQQLTVVPAQLSESGCKRTIGYAVELPSGGHITRLTQSLLQRDPATASTALVGEHTSRTRQQPRQRVRRHVIQASPGDHEHLADGLLGCGLIYPPKRVGTHGGRVIDEQLLQALTAPQFAHALTPLAAFSRFRCSLRLRVACRTSSPFVFG